MVHGRLFVLLISGLAACSNTGVDPDPECDPGFEQLDGECVDQDECALGTDDCDAEHGLCANTEGGWTCDCAGGWQIEGDGHSCVNVDECLTAPCDATNGICTDNDGSYECGCESGWTLDADGVTCVNVDECALGTDDCDDLGGTCSDTDGGWTCGCETGWTLQGDGVTCADDDECALGTDSCDDSFGTCVDVEGGYACGCLPGWELDADGETCLDSCQATTRGDSEYYFCASEVTWDDAATHCADYGGRLVTFSDQGEEDWVLGEAGALGVSAHPWIGLHQAGTEDWLWHGDAPSAFTHWAPGEPNNLPTEDCGMVWLDGEGWNDSPCGWWRPFVCEVGCEPGYLDDGAGTCENIDECAEELDDCDAAHGTCGDTEGSYSCGCTGSYVLGTDGRTCEPCDAASKDGSDYLFCDSSVPWDAAADFCADQGGRLVTVTDAAEDAWLDATSASLGLSATPWLGLNDIVSEGQWVWQGDASSSYRQWSSGEPNDYATGEDCAALQAGGNWNDIPCSSDRAVACELTCEPGTTLGADGVTCEDIDECLAGTDACDDEFGSCQNTFGGYTCSCDSGWSLDTDGHTCADGCLAVTEAGRDYLVCDQTASWFEAQSHCGAYDAHLVTISGSTEDSWVSTQLTGASWTGLFFDQQYWDWRWDDGSALGYGATLGVAPWASGQPDSTGGPEACVQANGSWDDVGCWTELPFVCEWDCEPGQELVSGTCQDIDECAAGTDGCDQSCANTTGGYECGCDSGYTLAGDGHTCLDDDECALGTDDCDELHGTCSDTDGGWTCGCEVGWSLDADGTSCVDSCAEVSEGASDYLICDSGASWQDAQDHCLDRGYRLVTLSSDVESDWLQSVLDDEGVADYPWTGLNDLQAAGTWRWDDGAALRHDGWMTGQPSNPAERCAELRPDGWNDSFCELDKPYVCERGCEEPVEWAVNGHLYWRCPAQEDYADALQRCDALGGTLASATSREEMQFLADLVPATDSHWLGGNDIGGSWEWTTGEEFHSSLPGWVPWRSGEPNDCCGGEDCLSYLPSGVDERWNDRSCEALSPYVCEAEVAWNEPVVSSRGALYQYSPTELSWNDARVACEARGLRLAQVQDVVDQDFIAAITYAPTEPWVVDELPQRARFDAGGGGPGDDHVWLGGRQDAWGAWRWSDGSALALNGWQPGQPGEAGGPNDCLDASWGHPEWGWLDGSWNDMPCGERTAFLCESPYTEVTDKHILFAHGMGASATEWDQMAPFARDMGFTPHRMSLSAHSPSLACDYLANRATVLGEYVATLPVPDHGLKALGHSMGGLDLRYIVASHYGGDSSFDGAARKLAKVYTIGTPHRGNQLSMAADAAIYGGTTWVMPCDVGSGANTDLGNDNMDAFNGAHPYWDFQIDDVPLPFLAFYFWADTWPCSNTSGPVQWRTDCTVDRYSQIWENAPAYGGPNGEDGMGARHSADMPFAHSWPSESSMINEVERLLLRDWTGYPLVTPPEGRIVFLRSPIRDLTDLDFDDSIGDSRVLRADTLTPDTLRDVNDYEAYALGFRLDPMGGGSWQLRTIVGSQDPCVAWDGGGLVRRPCSVGDTAQSFELLDFADNDGDGADDDGVFQIQNSAGGICLSARTGVAACGSQDADLQLIESQDRWVWIVSDQGAALSVSGNGPVGSLWVEPLSGAAHESFTLARSQSGDGTVELRPAYRDIHDEHALCVTPDRTQPCHAGNEQSWRLLPLGGGDYMFQARVSGEVSCMASPAGTSGDVTFDAGPCDSGNPRHRWTVRPAGTP